MQEQELHCGKGLIHAERQDQGDLPHIGKVSGSAAGTAVLVEQDGVEALLWPWVALVWYPPVVGQQLHRWYSVVTEW